MGQEYHVAQREWQDRFDTRRLADRLAQATTAEIDEGHKRFIEARDMFFIASVGVDGMPECSYKGGAPGFVRVVEPSCLAFPNYDGNGMFLTVGNLTSNPQVGLLFIDFETGTRLRVNGRASVDHDDPLVDSYPGAKFVVRVRTQAVFANCRRYVHRYRLEARSEFVPTAEEEPPVPDWKLDPWFEGALPAEDPALDPDRPRGASIPEF